MVPVSLNPLLDNSCIKVDIANCGTTLPVFEEKYLQTLFS
jgi:hypothetical protein